MLNMAFSEQNEMLNPTNATTPSEPQEANDKERTQIRLLIHYY